MDLKEIEEAANRANRLWLSAHDAIHQVDNEMHDLHEIIDDLRMELRELGREKERT